jgi:concanavalin A-like lectin/glucanase superfamily protein/flagellar hook capping protein FlgD
MSLGRCVRALGPSLVLLLWSLVAPSAHAQTYGQRTFAAGSLIIPMDTDYQDSGMLSAFGLVDALLRQHVPVWWCINPTKQYGTLGDVDFTVTQARDLQTTAVISSHGYRGGPFVIDAGDVSRASFIVHNWQVAHPEVTVHVADGSFITPYWQVMTASPRIAVLASTRQSVAFAALGAAGILDENGLAWSGTSVDVISAPVIDGGALIDAATGSALYNALLMPGWDAPGDAGTRSAITTFLNDPVLLFAEDTPAAELEGTGGLLTTSGLGGALAPSTVQYGPAYSPFFQMDARPTTAFQPDASGHYFSPGAGNFFDPGVEMLRGTGAPSGNQDVWLAGYVKGTCDEQHLGVCSNSGPKGRVAYLSGYYSTSLPISTHPQTQGTRLFLDALFAGSCTVAEAQPTILVGLGGPNTVIAPTLTVSVLLGNATPVMATNVTLTYTPPPGAQFVSATNGGQYASGVVTWFGTHVGNNQSLGGSVTITLPSVGSYTSTASATYRVGNTSGLTSETGTLQTQFNCPTPGMVADWPAEGSAVDVTGNNHNGVLQNGATFAAGKLGSAFSLDGVNDNVSVPNGPDFNFSNAMSVAGWINTTAGVDRYIATKHEDSFYFAVGGGSVAPHKLSFWLNGVSSSWFTGSTSVDDGQWHHVAATCDGTAMRLYVDGQLDASASRTGTIQTGPSAILIGARSDGTNASNFPGLIDELALYNRALGSAEIQALAAQSEPCAAVSVGDAPAAAGPLRLSPPWPNPATQRMNFEFRTPDAAVVHAEILDIAGRRVSRPLKDQLLPGGTHRFEWDGLDASGARVAPGVYLIRLTSGTAATIQRIVLLP